ncbi:MAG: TldD/PmbA family protein, partial [Stellaceae bacterium]
MNRHKRQDPMPKPDPTPQDALALLDDLIGRARKAGADAADAVLIESASLSHAQRLGKVEKLERSENYDLGLRVLIGKRQAIVSSNDRREAALGELVERAIAMAKTVPEDPYCGLAAPEELARDWPELDLTDPVEPAPETLIARAAAAEDAARAVPGVTNSEGAEASWTRSRVAIAASNGFAGTYEGTGHGVSASVLAGEGTGMERDYDFTSAVHASDLEDPAAVGRRAGERAVRRL